MSVTTPYRPGFFDVSGLAHALWTAGQAAAARPKLSIDALRKLAG